ncbi:MAG: putative phosphodiesterase [Verrucomicrobiales bacterium]|jgi:predicted phosphodiesterase
MRYAIFSDIHANLHAWEQALADIQKQQVDVLVCLGDIVGYGPKPEEVLNAIRSVTDNFVMGNHDAAAAGAIETSYFNDDARGAIEWTITALSAEAREFLASVPLAIQTENILFVHAEICEPGRFGYIDSVADAHANFAGTEQFVTFVGHTHHPCIFELSNDGSVVQHPDSNCQLLEENRYIVNVGSVGEPRSPDDLRGRYVVYDSATREVDFRGVSFNISKYRADLEATTLPVKPYFVQVFEHMLDRTGAPLQSAARAIDMQIADGAAPLIVRRRGPASIHMPTGRRRFAHRPVQKSGNAMLFVVIGAVLALGIAVGMFLKSDGDSKPKTEGSKELPAPVLASAPAEPTTTIVEPATPELGPAPVADSEPQTEPEPPSEPPAAAVVIESGPPLVSIDFSLSKSENQSGSPLNADGLKLEGQEDAWHELRIRITPGADTTTELKVDSGAGVFTFNPGNAAAYQAFGGSGDDLRQDGVLLTSETPGPIAWSLTGLTPRAGYDLIFFARSDNGIRGNPVDFAIAGHGADEPVELDSDNDGNFTSVAADASGEIHGTFALRSGEDHSGWAGLQFRENSDPLVAAVPSMPKPPQPSPTPDPTPPTPTPTPSMPKPESASGASGHPLVAWWRMEPDSAGNTLVDALENHSLPAQTPGKQIGGLAPEILPANGMQNTAAVSIGVWTEPTPDGTFALLADRSFTFEGWILSAKPESPVFIAGTRSGEANDSQGWHLDIRPPSNSYPNGQMAFFYDSGSEIVQALSKDLPVGDLKPHHFAVVWDHDGAAAAGEMQLYFDGDQVASAEVPHAQIPASQANPFRIGAPNNPPRIGLDEFCFSHAAFGSSAFLNAEDSGPELVAYYPLNDGEDGSPITGADDLIDDPEHPAQDATPEGRGGTWVNDPERGIVYNSVNNHRLNLGTQGIDLEDGFTWSFWVNASSSNANDPSPDILIGTRNGAPFHKVHTDSVAFWAKLGGYTIPYDAWHHIAYCGDKTGVSLYIDGELASTGVAPAVPTFNEAFELGGSSRFGEGAVGMFSDLSVWKAMLSEELIQTLASGKRVSELKPWKTAP